MSKKMPIEVKVVEVVKELDSSIEKAGKSLSAFGAGVSAVASGASVVDWREMKRRLRVVFVCWLV